MYRELEAGNSELFLEYYKKGGDLERCCNMVWGGYGRWGGTCTLLSGGAISAYYVGNKEPLYVYINDPKVGTNAMRSYIAHAAVRLNDTIFIKELVHNYNTTLINFGDISKERIDLLKEIGYDFSKSDEDGNNLLTSYMGSYGVLKLEVVQYLVDAGADPCSVFMDMTKFKEENIKNSYGRAEGLEFLKQFDCCQALKQRIKNLEKKIINDDYKYEAWKEHNIEILENLKENLIPEFDCK